MQEFSTRCAKPNLRLFQRTTNAFSPRRDSRCGTRFTMLMPLRRQRLIPLVARSFTGDPELIALAGQIVIEKLERHLRLREWAFVD